MNNFKEFLNQCEKVGSTEVRTTVYPNAVLNSTGERGIYIYSHFEGVDCDSFDAFVTDDKVQKVEPADVTFG